MKEEGTWDISRFESVPGLLDHPVDDNLKADLKKPNSAHSFNSPLHSEEAILAITKRWSLWHSAAGGHSV
jgi:hypothetical protein